MVARALDIYYFRSVCVGALLWRSGVLFLGSARSVPSRSPGVVLFFLSFSFRFPRLERFIPDRLLTVEYASK